MNDVDRRWMQRALDLAERGRGLVEPNPLVGAVVVRADQFVGAGWHERYGQAHAEVNALAAAGPAARGATLYVTLEPCCHHGKTPPCTDAIVRAGIERVVAAMPDPFPQVAGKGIALLREAGVYVDVDVAAAEARRLNAPYLKLLSTGRPYVHAKWAMSLDGKIATRTGDSRWISGAASRQWVHSLRGRMDAIVVGAATARRDDPLLTARPAGPRTPVRIVLGGTGPLAPESQLVRTAREAPVLVVCADAAAAQGASRLREAGCEVLHIPAADRAAQIGPLLDELGRRRMTNILVEGGAGVLGSFRDAGAIDEVHVFVAPLLIGGAGSVPALTGRGATQIADALRLTDWQFETMNGDLLIHGRFERAEEQGPEKPT
jgi:diaminohydroxyphosphoribosylaminopyrimidine deaminase/5-amino-6-(5-phosphoribosylamino)uracil reductase